MIKAIKYSKLVIYICSFASLFLAVNIDGHGQWFTGIRYIIELFNGEDAERWFWFGFYFLVFIVPVAAQIAAWYFSKNGVLSDMADVFIGTALSTVMFIYLLSFAKKPAGVIVIIVLEIIVIVLSLIDLASRIFLEKYFDELLLSFKEKSRIKK